MSAVLTPRPQTPAPVQELEASSRVLTLVRDTALFLGASHEQAKHASRTGTIALESRTIALVPAVDEEALIMAAPLPADCLDDPTRRVAALHASTQWMLSVGAIFARGFGGRNCCVGVHSAMLRRRLSPGTFCNLLHWPMPCRRAVLARYPKLLAA